jgi:hypothetical protein
MKLNLLLYATVAVGLHCSPSAFAQSDFLLSSSSQRGSLVSIAFDRAEVSEFESSASDLDQIQIIEGPIVGSADPYALPTVAPPPPHDPVETIIANSPSMVPSGTHFAPLYWSGYGRAPNPLADYMRLQWCAEGLWDSHPAERAAQCAKQAHLISGAWRHNCSHCNCSPCSTGCSANTLTGCKAHGSCKPPVNRYLLLKQYELRAACDASPQ